MTYRYNSHGKLLLTGEYVVLDGALALAIPTTFGQSLAVTPLEEPTIEWLSLDHEGKEWLRSKFKFRGGTDFGLETVETSDGSLSMRLVTILENLNQLNPSLFKKHKGYEMVSHLGFPRNWGLGSSSTLINNLSKWADVDPYLLLADTFGGSGYDIACAKADSSITYQLQPKSIPKRYINRVNFNPQFADRLWFVHLNKKQNSREGIAKYRSKGVVDPSLIEDISSISKEMIDCIGMDQFQKLMKRHEDLISEWIGIKPIQERLFPDFKGSVKSLGAWGGDFVMVASEHDVTDYFSSKGFHSIVPYAKMAFNKKALPE